jgi:hypothetical protein
MAAFLTTVERTSNPTYKNVSGGMFLKVSS